MPIQPVSRSSNKVVNTRRKPAPAPAAGKSSLPKAWLQASETPSQLSPQAVLQLQRTVGNQAVGNLLAPLAQRQQQSGRPTPVAKSAPTNAIIQRQKFSVKAINEDKRGERPVPGALLDSLIKSHPVFAEIWKAPDAKINLRVDYAGGKDHGGTKIVHTDGITWFFITIYWAEQETYEEAAATFLHEALIHVLPGWRQHLAEKENGTLSNETFPDHTHEIEGKEHADVELWVEAIKAGKTINKGVVQELVQDAYHYLGTQGIVEVCKQIGMPQEVLLACLEGTFAPKAKVEVVSKNESSSSIEMEEDKPLQQQMVPQDNMMLLERMEDAINYPWKAGSRFRVKGTQGFHCLVTADHTPGQLLIDHLTYVFELI